MKGKFLVHRTIAPRLSELLSELHSVLTIVHPNTKNFAVLIHDDGEEIKTRVLPLTDHAMDELYEVSNDKITYTAYTDGEHNFTRGEEK